MLFTSVYSCIITLFIYRNQINPIVCKYISTLYVHVVVALSKFTYSYLELNRKFGDNEKLLEGHLTQSKHVL